MRRAARAAAAKPASVRRRRDPIVLPRRRFLIVISGPHGDKIGHGMCGAMLETAGPERLGGWRFSEKGRAMGVPPWPALVVPEWANRPIPAPFSTDRPEKRELARRDSRLPADPIGEPEVGCRLSATRSIAPASLSLHERNEALDQTACRNITSAIARLDRSDARRSSRTAPSPSRAAPAPTA